MVKSPLWDNFHLRSKKSDDKAFDLLKKTPVFENIKDRDIKRIRSMCHQRHYKQDEHIFRSGEPGVGMYIIIDGKVEIYNDDQDFHQEYAILYSGEFFGEIALLDNMPRTASAIARGYSTLLGFYRPDLLSLRSRNPVLAGSILMNIARLIGRRLVSTNRELEKVQMALREKGKRRSILQGSGISK